MRKNETCPLPYIIYKNQFLVYYQSKSKNKTIKFLEEYTGQYFYDLGIDVNCNIEYRKTIPKGNDC